MQPHLPIEGDLERRFHHHKDKTCTFHSQCSNDPYVFQDPYVLVAVRCKKRKAERQRRHGNNKCPKGYMLYLEPDSQGLPCNYFAKVISHECVVKSEARIQAPVVTLRDI